MKKILKNTTVADIELLKLGITIPASSSYTIDPLDYNLLATDPAILETSLLITSGDIVINDGTADLNPSAGLRLLQFPNGLELQINGITAVKELNVLNIEGDVTFLESTPGSASVEITGTASRENFSYHLIKLDKTVTILEDQHMLCANLEIDGFLELDGSLYFI